MLRSSSAVLLLTSVLACAAAETDAARSQGEVEAKPAQPEAAKPEAAKPEAERAQPEGRTDIKTKGNLPVVSESELAAQDEQRQTCVSDCVQRRQMEARGIEAIEADCRAECEQQHPTEQVEVVPDRPPGL